VRVRGAAAHGSRVRNGEAAQVPAGGIQRCSAQVVKANAGTAGVPGRQAWQGGACGGSGRQWWCKRQAVRAGPEVMRGNVSRW